MNKCKLYISYILLLSNMGCATAKYQRRANEFHANVQHLAEASPNYDDFVRRFGAPNTCANLSNGRICEWSSNIGTVSNGVATMQRGNPYLGYGGNYQIAMAGRQRNISKTLRVEFNKDGRYVRSDAIIKRGDEEYVGK